MGEETGNRKRFENVVNGFIMINVLSQNPSQHVQVKMEPGRPKAKTIICF